MFAKTPRRQRRVRSFVSIAVCLLVSFGATAVLADRPSAMKLFPEETLLLVRTPNVHEFAERLKETATGRMVRDPQLEPFITRLYGSAGDLYTERLAEMLGVSWEELQNLPQDEVAFAIVARRDFGPAFVLLVDQGDVPSVTKRLMDSGLERLREQGGELTTETIAGEEVTVVRAGDNQDRVIGLFEKENTIVAATDAGLLREVLRHWQAEGESASAAVNQTDDESTNDETSDDDASEDVASDDAPPQYSGRSLSEHDKFVSILRQCRRPHDPPPNLILYADPIGMFREFGRDNAGLKIAMAMLPALGVDGLAGVGGTMALSAGEYDDLSHMHVLLDNPRAGVMQLIAFEPGDITPQPWVYADLETYMTWHWNVRATFDTLTALIDRFQFDGATQKFITERINESLGIDLEAEVIDNLGKRFSLFAGYERPARFRGQQSTLSMELVDPQQAEKTLATIVAKFPERFEQRQFGDVTYYAFVIEWPEQLADDPPSNPFIAVMDGNFFIGGSCQLFERAIAARDGTHDRLADEPGYRQMVDQVEREMPGVTPALWMYNRFEETLRQWYDLLTSERTRAFLDQRADSNPMFAALVDALEAEELPPFDVLARYTAPAAGIIYDSETGFHGISFTLRGDSQSDER
jgi:ribosomal protein S18 acetylase RimI-like enzyme